MMSWPYPFWFAHRGAGRDAPENTLAAFRLGARHGFTGFECDVTLSSDGVPFLLHDATLDRTTNGSGTAASMTWQALSRLDAGSWHDPAFAGEPLPSLEALARHCLTGGGARSAVPHSVNLEIKPGTGHDAVTGKVVAASAAAWWSGADVPPLLSSFSAAALAAARDAASHLPRALLLSALRPRWLDEAVALGCDAVVLEHTLAGRAPVDAAHAAGLRVLCYTVDDPAEAARLRGLGVDGIITNAMGMADAGSGAVESNPIGRGGMAG